jgi:hypothetical protein
MNSYIVSEDRVIQSIGNVYLTYLKFIDKKAFLNHLQQIYEKETYCGQSSMQFTSKLYDIAIYIDDIDLLNWLDEINCQINTEAVKIASYYGSLSSLIWLYMKGYKVPTDCYIYAISGMISETIGDINSEIIGSKKIRDVIDWLISIKVPINDEVKDLIYEIHNQYLINLFKL